MNNNASNADEPQKRTSDLSNPTPLDTDDYWIDEEGGFDDEPQENAPDSLTTALDARSSVEEWHIRSVGHRPLDFLARDCLFGSLFRDRRVPWFHRYVKRPSPWMESLVAHLPTKSDRDQALRYVILHFLHKLHLSRLVDFLSHLEESYEEVDPKVAKTLKRLWNCTPYGVEVTRVDSPGKPRPGCNLPRLCPWCHARKVAKLYEILSNSPLNNQKLLYLFLAKGAPFAERIGGVDGRYRAEDWHDTVHGGNVRGHWGRYFGRNSERLKHTRSVLVSCLLEQSSEIGLRNGMWTHQLGSAALENGQRTFLHDIAMIAEVDEETLDRMPKDDEGKVFWGGWQYAPLPDIDAALTVLWLPLPLDNPSALRVALAGSSVRYAVSQLELPPEWFGTQDGYRSGIPGALSWQPTISFDDQMWFVYARAVKNQQLYRPFGSWKKSMASVAKDTRTSIDRKFHKTQGKRFAHDRQQKGNRQRSRNAKDRRTELLTVARELWPLVVAEPSKSKGRPGHRKRLAEMLGVRGVEPSKRDLDWLMGQFTSV